jgi:hypothetical protein
VLVTEQFDLVLSALERLEKLDQNAPLVLSPTDLTMQCTFEPGAQVRDPHLAQLTATRLDERVPTRAKWAPGASQTHIRDARGQEMHRHVTAARPTADAQ